jgi:hypothetical protein
MEPQKDIQKDIVPVYTATNDFYDHAQKIVTALYLLTDLFEDREPIKWSLRSKVLETMSYTGVLSHSVGPALMDIDGGKILEQVSEIKSLLNIGVLSGIVSPMNHDILSRELSVFQENAVRHIHLMNGNQSLYTESLFSRFDWTSAPKAPHIPQGHFKKTQNTSKGQKNVSKRDDKKVLYNKPQKETQGTATNERKEKILKLVQEKGSVMIKDISPVFDGFSEKTIQRDLLDLVSQGLLQKSGERRWTTYSRIA